ncbi:MAG: LamG domain-containing protein [Pirellulales bacterium]|nr:LamG domain-containing protein [Pirellulales bacterium]
MKNDDSRVEYDVTRILMAAVDGNATLDELAEVNRRILADPSLASFVVDVMSQESWLTWYSTKSRNGGSMRADLLEQIVATASSAKSAGTSTGTVPQRDPAFRPVAGATAAWRARLTRASRSSYWATAAALLAVAAGWTLGFGQASRQFSQREYTAPSLAEPGSLGEPRYAARFVQGTACLWNLDGRAAYLTNDTLHTGETLNLLEGLAELQVDWTGGRAALSIEGPAGLVLTAERGASLSHGKLTAEVKSTDSQFILTTPNGQIEVASDASLGIAIAGGDVELHVFTGQAFVSLPWTADSTGVKRVGVKAGESLRVAANADGMVSMVRGESSPGAFASQTSMGSDGLHVTREYAREVLAAQPLIYWRFEDKNPQRINNAAADRYHGRVVGVAEMIRDRSNQYLDLGAALTDEAYSTYLVSEEPIRESFDAGYAVEAWIKPSHYHWCSLVALICPPPEPDWRSPHALLLELGGPRAAESSIEHPGRLRFLHRNPPSDVAGSGTSVFSEELYDLRRWQHVVAVKEGDRLKLYVNGKLSATGVDPTPLASGWRLLVGQLDEKQNYRRFIGQIDELAVYPHPLSEQDIVRHYELIRHPRRTEPRNPEASRTARKVRGWVVPQLIDSAANPVWAIPRS